MVGSSRIQRSQNGITVFTCVCCSMISETQMAYGSRVRRQGRSRALCANQSSNAATGNLTLVSFLSFGGAADIANSLGGELRVETRILQTIGIFRLSPVGFRG